MLERIGREADRRGLRAYAVGGFVRDLILRRVNLDLDVVVEGQVAAMAKSLARALGARLTLYSQFGTATLVFPDGRRVDLAMARVEEYPQPGALPVVRPGSIRDDLFRRDFTINAMAMEINKKNFGQLVDLYNGWKDLHEKKIRVLHRQSFIDDPTRVLRAVRFEQRFRFKMDAATLKLLKAALTHGAVARVKPERYFDEFRKILKEQEPVPALLRLSRLGGLDFFKTGYVLNARMLAGIQRQIKIISRNSIYKKKDWYYVYFMALAGSLPLAQQQSVFARFNLTREERNGLQSLAIVEQTVAALRSPRLKSSQVYQILRPLDPETICFIRATTSVNIVALHIDSFFLKLNSVRTDIDGDDLRKLGLNEGKEIGQILARLLYAKLDRPSLDRRAQRRMAEQFIKDQGKAGQSYGSHG